MEWRAKINWEVELVSEIKIVLNHTMTENMLEEARSQQISFRVLSLKLFFSECNKSAKSAPSDIADLYYKASKMP